VKKYLKFIFIILVLAFVTLITVSPGFFVIEKSSNLISKNVTNNKTIAYLINMDVSLKRLQHTKPYVEQLGLDFQRMPGVEGNKISDQQIKEIFDKQVYQKYSTNEDYITKGVLGCSMSHFLVWRRFLESDYQYALILEDDISFDPQLLNKAIAELTSIHYSKKWDVVTFLKNSTGDTVSIAKILKNYDLNLTFKNVSGANAYIINRKAASAYVNHFFPIKMPVDLYYSKAHEFGIKFFSFEPMIVHHANLSSESGKADRIYFNDKPKYHLLQTIYHQKTKIIRILYNLKILAMELVLKN
jgi:glycosyl transferase, family 25